MSMTEGVVEEWYIPNGGTVGKGELLYRLETEKVNLDVDAEAAGTVIHLVAEGVTMHPGDVVGHIYATGETIPETAATTQPTQHSTAVAPHAVSAGPDSSAARAVDPSEGSTRRVSPVARKTARELGVDLGSVEGTGPGGRITREDVEAAALHEPVATLDDVAAKLAPKRADQVIPLKGMRKTIASRMHESLMTTAQLTMDMEVRMSDALKLRAQLIDEWSHENIRPTYTDLVIRAVAKALAQHPHMNSQLTESELVLKGDIHVGMAVALEDGLIVPVISNADRLSLRETALESARLAEAARSGSLSVDDLHGGTFTVSSLGMFGVDSFTPIINSPQAGILGVNRIRDDVAWEGNIPTKTQTMRLSLTWDHRILDGAPAAGFLAEVRDLLEAPYRLLV
ncbi:MAG: dihydrolipoamide acetyltransferase family protein, partial [Pseudomonadales bacterium]